MEARDAVRLKFTHPDCEKPQTSESARWCHGNTLDGSRCEQVWRKMFYGFRFCRRHFDAASEWVGKTSLDGKTGS